MRKLLLSFAVLVAFQGLALADPLVGPSFWRNQRGSTVEIKWTFVSSFGGTFINQAKGYACKGIPYDANGTSTPIGVSFGVHFEKCNSFTEWTGHISDDGKTMSTSWKLFVFSPDSPPQVLTGADVFTRLR
jgi:hypothetical protein